MQQTMTRKGFMGAAFAAGTMAARAVMTGDRKEKQVAVNFTLADGTKCSAVDEYDTGTVRYILFEKVGGTRHTARILKRVDGDELVYIGSCITVYFLIN